MTFLSPLFLIGIASAAIPLIIHLSRSRRTKTMRFSTTRFFTDQFLRSYRMSRVKELLLLMCRMALFGLLAVALAQPLVLSKDSPTLMAGSRSVVFVVDNSASMSHRVDGQPLIDQVRKAAKDVLDGLQPGDTASIVLAGRQDAGPTVLFETPVAELGDIRQELTKLEPLTLGTDLSSAVKRAEILVKSSPASSKEVYILSDLQDSGWEIDESSSGQKSGSDVSFTFVRLRPNEPDNLAVTAVQYSAARPMIAVPFEIKPYVVFQGPRTECDVRLVVDGKKVSEVKVQRPAGTMFATPRFHHAFLTPGWHHGYIEVVDEVLPMDNRRYFAFEIVESVKILAVNGASSQVAHLDELIYLKAALGVTTEEDTKSPIEVVSISPGEFTNKPSDELNQYPLIVLANVESLPAGVVERLEAYADRGGRVFVFLGDKVNRSFYNDSLASSSRLHGGLLPGKLRKLEGDPAGSDNFAYVADVDYDHVALAAFQDPRFANLNTVRFKAMWDVDPGDSRILMRTSTGVPVLTEKPFGRGIVLLFSSTCDRDWTNFPVRPAFLPWTHRLIGYLAQEPLGRQNFFATGAPVAVPAGAIEGNVPILVKLPDESTGYPTPDKDDPTTLVFSDTKQAGIYAFARSDQLDRPAYVAVNLESYESDLTYLDDVLADRISDEKILRDDKISAGFQTLLPSHPEALVRYVGDPNLVSEASLSTRRGTKLWDVLLIIVLIIALLEPWLANWISMRHYGKPQEITNAGGVDRTGRGAGRLSTRPEEVTA